PGRSIGPRHLDRRQNRGRKRVGPVKRRGVGVAVPGYGQVPEMDLLEDIDRSRERITVTIEKLQLGDPYAIRVGLDGDRPAGLDVGAGERRRRERSFALLDRVAPVDQVVDRLLLIDRDALGA